MNQKQENEAVASPAMSAAPPAGMTAAEQFWRDPSTCGELDVATIDNPQVFEFAEAYAAHLRGEVERLKASLTELSQLIYTENKRASGLAQEVERLREQVRQQEDGEWRSF